MKRHVDFAITVQVDDGISDNEIETRLESALNESFVTPCSFRVDSIRVLDPFGDD